MKNTLSIIDDVIANGEYNNYFTRQLRDIIANKGIDFVREKDNFLSHIQTEKDYKQIEGEKNYGLMDGEIGVSQNEKSAISTMMSKVASGKQDETIKGFHDYTLRHLALANFRKFPTKDGVPYGINLMDDWNRTPLSTILYGGNGCGKSSLYDALQYLYLGKCTNITSKKLIYANDTRSGFKIYAITAEERCESAQTFNGQKTLTMTADVPAYIKDLLEAFFCSEYDINQIIEKEILKDYLYKQIGYGEANSLCQILEKLHIDAKNTPRNIADQEEGYDDDFGDEEIMENKSLVPNIVYMEEGLADTYSLIQFVRDEKNKKALSEVINNLHRPIVISFDPIRDGSGKLTNDERIKRFNDLKNEVHDIMLTLNKERQRLAHICGEYNCILLSVYEQLINLFEGIDPDNEKEQHLVVKSHFFSKLKQFNYKEGENKLNYHIDRIKRVLAEPAMNMKSESIFIKNEVWAFGNARAKLIGIEEKKQKITNNQKLVEIDSYLFAFLQKYRETMISRINAIIAPMKDTIQTILQDFDMDGDEVIVIHDETNADLRVTYLFNHTRGSEPVEFNPQGYLNSFRLKLYGISVKIALAFAFMKTYNFTFPLVFDDIFFASDFNHRKCVKDFVRHIFACYESQCNSKVPLQLIFLTHDDVVFDAVADAFIHRDDFIQGLLFDYRDVEDSDLVKVKNTNEEGNEPAELSYYNIYVRK